MPLDSTLPARTTKPWRGLVLLGRAGALVRAALTTGLVLLVRAYQRWISPLTGPRCRFYPSCSAYAVTALQRHGPLRGSRLAAWRLLRCHPWNLGGVDHVPPVDDATSARIPGQPLSRRDHRLPLPRRDHRLPLPRR